MRSDLIDIECEYRYATESAIAIYDGQLKDGQEVWIWLPKSQIEFQQHPPSLRITVTLPEWLAIEKGLV